jgi:hypothetical protein
MPDEDMYGGGGGMDAGTSAGPEDHTDMGPEEMEKKDENGEHTELLSKAFFQGKEPKPGEEWIIKIVHDHGDDVEVAYATGKDKGMEEGMSEGPEMGKVDQKLGEMAY